MLTGSLVFLLIALVIGWIVAVYAGVHSSLAELAMLFGIGGWPGRLATVQAVLWFPLVYIAGPPDEGWLLYTMIGLLVIGSIATPFYLNNRSLLETIQNHAHPVGAPDRTNVDDSLVPTSGVVVMGEDAAPAETPVEIEAVTSPFTATRCAAYEWAVKTRQRLSRRRTYTTVDSGERAGTFLIDTGEHFVGIQPTDPTLLLVFGVGVTGYQTSTRDPSGEAGDDLPDGLGGTVVDDMRYCETTVCEGDRVTVVGPAQPSANGNSLSISDSDTERLYIINEEFSKIKRLVDRYLRWTPHIAGLCLLLSWAYLGWLFF